MSAIERGVLDHPSHQLFKRNARVRRERGQQRRFGYSRLRIDFETDEPSRPLDPVVITKVRPAHAPAAERAMRRQPLVFGPVGKQSMKTGAGGEVFCAALRGFGYRLASRARHRWECDAHPEARMKSGDHDEPSGGTPDFVPATLATPDRV
jgi:hypothetical protein